MVEISYHIISIAAVFFQFPAILLIMLQVDLIIAISHHPLACHDFLEIGLSLLVLLPYFVYLHLVFLIVVCLEMSSKVQLYEISLPFLNPFLSSIWNQSDR